MALPLRADAAGERIAVAWDDVALEGRLAAQDAAPPYAFVTPTLSLGGDGLVRAEPARVLHLSRTTGVLTLVDAQAWTIAASFALGAAELPRDIAVIDADSAYVSRRNARFLWRLDLESGARVDAVDLAPLGAGDGNPAQDTMLVHEGRLYLQLAGEPGTSQPHALAVIDLASETLVDADPDLPGIQGIALVGTGPRFKMQIVPGANQLLVSATGAFHDDGGLERIDLTNLTSMGLEVFEQIEAGADLGAFVQLDGSRGWLVFSTDLLLSSHLHPYTFETGMDSFEADVLLDYFVPHMVYVRPSNTLFWPEPDGVQPFDGTTGVPRADATPLPVAGIPTDLALLASAQVAFAAPAWAYAALVLGIAATGLMRRV
ncbi:MAG TPA: hypothetical protein VNF72_01475 [Myxococcota bacterium]|nr:hypothetical protein [Myxococcota bacterium]